MRAVLIARKFYLAAGATLFIILTAPQSALAQDGENCRVATRSDAAEVCRSYVLSLQQAGDQDEALAALERALDWHPGNTELLDLKSRLGAKISEDEQLQAAQRRDTTAQRRGQLKFACLTKSGRTGVDACRNYLSATDVDGERIRERLAELSPAAPKIPITGPEITQMPKPEREVEAPVVVKAPSQLPEVDPDAERRRALIASIQSILGELGIPAGIADGVAGRLTRKALATFFARTGEPSRNALDERTLARLREELPRLASARRLLADSRAAERDGRSEMALVLLERAARESALFEEPVGYRAVLGEAVARAETARRESELAKTEESDARTATPDAASLPAEGATALLDRIGQFERTLEQRRVVEQSETVRLRAAVTVALAR